MDIKKEALRTAMADLRTPGRRVGIWAGIGTGLGVSMVVSRAFLEVAGDEDSAWVLIPLLVAAVCTTFGTFLATRASTTGSAVMWVFVANVVPPTLMCLPTVLGLLFAIPSGLVAFLLVLPAALLARWSARLDEPGHAERDALVGAGFATFAALLLALWEHAEPTTEAPVLSPVPGVLAAGLALALASWTLIRGLLRTRIVRALAAGRVPGLRLASNDQGTFAVEQAVDIGGGPHRGAVTRDVIGAIRPAPARTVGAAITATLALVALVAVVAA
jgi:hypothetical protein